MRNLFSRIVLFFFLFVSLSNTYLPQDKLQTSSELITVIPGAEYEAGWIHKFLFGKHWRDLWTLPIEANVLYLEKFTGGLVPSDEEENELTSFLVLKGSDGNYWKFKPLQKDYSKIFPAYLQQSVADDVMEDQYSFANPFASFIAAPLLRSVGILQPEPILVYLPKSNLLGEFNDEFGDLLGLLVIIPLRKDSNSSEDKTIFLNSIDLINRLEENKNERVSATDYLTTRLMDIFLDDWDIHTDKWNWVKDCESDIWKPNLRDRELAFSKFDGLLPTVAAYYNPQIVTFDNTYLHIDDMTWSGRFLDQRFLTELNHHTWDSVASFVQNKLTDDEITSAINRIPLAHREIAGEEMIYNLISRRDYLKNISDEFYNLINKYVDVYGSALNDYAEITRLNGRTNVKLYLKQDLEKTNYKPYYQKVFDHSITKDLRIHLLAGNDKAVVRGKVNSGIIIRIIGGDGEDELIDSSVVSGYLFSILPIYDADIQTKFYDSGKHTKFISSPSTLVDRKIYLEPEIDKDKNQSEQRDRGHDWVVLPIGNYNLDDGLIIGAGLSLLSYNFRFLPFEYKQTITASYATTPKSYQIHYSGLFNSLITGADFELDILKSELNFTKYFGYGNETSYSKDLNQNNYYRLGQELFQISPRLSFPLMESLKMKAGFSYSHSSASLANLKSIKNFKYMNYGLGKLRQFGIIAKLNIDTRDSPLITKKGFYFDIDASHYPAVFDITENFAQLNLDIRGYFTAQTPMNMTLALRCGGGKNWGKYPFYKSIFLGGENDLRGYRRQRFSGDAALFGQSELRGHLATIKIILNGRLGYHIFSEAGRVFAANEKSSKWHPSYGGGLWISYFQETMNFAFTYAVSPEDFSLLLSTELSF